MRFIRTGLSVMVLLTGGLVWSGASASGAATTDVSHFPVKVKTSMGTVTITSRPHAIVSLSATATEMLYAIGAGGQVKAVDKYSNYPTNAPITSLNGFSVSAEAIAKYKPDLVIVSYEPASFGAQMAKLKIPVIYDPAAPTLAVAYQQYLGLGEATGHVQQAVNEVQKLKSTIAGIVRSTPRVAPGTTYYWELDPTYYSVTSSTFMGQLMSLLGLKSIADAVGVNSNGGYPQLNSEFILKANPSYIFLADSKCCHASASTVASRPGWSVMSAVATRRILKLDDDIASRWGPRITILLRQVADFLKSQKG
ncbi:MAG: ABC transporter substrate-binding protein [Acidimicrobiaceae bacterium]|nr:ABC transporter substrate-binding protein [Acidimicrobiaceae bacterium]